MSAQPDLFAEPTPAAAEIVVDLRDRLAWRSIRKPNTAPFVTEYLKGVVESYCGRYTITWTDEQFLEGPQRYAAFRRQFEINPRTGELQRTHPVPLGSHDSPEQAREACAVHAEGNP